MKNIAYISALSLCIFFLCACNKNDPGVPGEPEPLLNRLDSVRAFSPAMASLGYSHRGDYLYTPEGRFKGDTFATDGTAYTYNNDGLVSKIIIQMSLHNGFSTIININYQNGLPVSGRIKHLTSSAHINPNATYWTDSILYTVTNGKVTEIKHIDYAEYRQFLPAGLVKSIPGTRSIHTLTYSGNNLTKVETANAAFAKVMTYGNRKGTFSANRLKFVLYENEDPRFSAENDLISIVDPINNAQPPKWEKTTYAYQYNTAGYPKSSVVSRTDANGQPLETYNLKYFYK